MKREGVGGGTGGSAASAGLSRGRKTLAGELPVPPEIIHGVACPIGGVSS